MRTTMFLLVTLVGILLVGTGVRKKNLPFKIIGTILILPFVLFVYGILAK